MGVFWKKLKRALSEPEKKEFACTPFGAVDSEEGFRFSLQPRFAAIDERGKRDYQEDSWQAVLDLVALPSASSLTSRVSAATTASCNSSIQLPLGPAPVDPLVGAHYFAVFDGHGGSSVSQYAARMLHVHLKSEVESKLKTTKMFEHLSSGTLETDPVQELISSSFHSAIKQLDQEIASTSYGKHTGSTAIVALLSPTHIWVANVGDSRAVLCRETETAELSNDHKSYRPDEVERVRKSGGFIRNGRVMGELAVARALGDHVLRPYVVSTPEITCTARCQEDQLLVLASDGLWDVLESEEVSKIALGKFMGELGKGSSRKAAAKKAAATLIKTAMAKGTMDNVTVVVVDARL